MGHLVGKDSYRQLGKKIDGLAIRVPWNKHLYAILKELYTPDEAQFIVNMPFALSNFSRLSEITGLDDRKLENLLDTLCKKGLVIDIFNGHEYVYTISPMVIGIFEFTMMRTDSNINFKEVSELFHNYLLGDSSFITKNSGSDKQVSFMRTMPYTDTIDSESFVEVYDYEKASEIIDMYNEFSIGLCSCRHEKGHLDLRGCDTPMETCTSFGSAAQYLIRNNLAKPIEKAEMLDILERSKDLGLTITADNVQNNVGFFCHCCGCCCNIMLAIKKFGSPNTIMTSNYIAVADAEKCSACSLCVKSCPVDALSISIEEGEKTVTVDNSLCLGCGVCVLKCNRNALVLKQREKRVFTPADTFERVILQSLERGTLHNLFIDNPLSISEKFTHGILGGFLKLSPVKMALMSRHLRSRFLSTVREKAEKAGL